MILAFFLLTLRSSLPGACAISIQTNGTLINAEILDICEEKQCNSIDKPRRPPAIFTINIESDSTPAVLLTVSWQGFIASAHIGPGISYSVDFSR